MKKYYKLTNQKLQTYKGFQWKIGKWVKAEGKSDALCTNGWLHCYEHPLLAVLHNPIHADFIYPRLFEVEVRGRGLFNGQVKCGFREMRIVKEIQLPKIAPVQKIAYGILCAKQIYKNKKWNKWADNWLNGTNRNHAAAVAAAYATTDAYAVAAAYAAAYAAAAVADAAAVAAAAAAAVAAAAYAQSIDLVEIAEQAMKIK